MSGAGPRPRRRDTKVHVSIRVSAADLAELERLGAAARPVPANRNQMIGVAIREYVERHRLRKPRDPRPPQPPRPG